VNAALHVYTIVVYTPTGTEPIEVFDWDTANVSHVLRHSVTPDEVEEAVGRPHIVIPARAVQGEERWKLFGTTAAKRYVVVVFTLRRRAFRAVTAYPMNAAERRKYAAQVESRT
jgi:uncharacterized DUF497 family protein